MSGYVYKCSNCGTEVQDTSKHDTIDCVRVLMAEIERLKQIEALVLEDRFGCEHKGKVVITHGRYFAIEHSLEQSDVCPICSALARTDPKCPECYGTGIVECGEGEPFCSNECPDHDCVDGRWPCPICRETNPGKARELLLDWCAAYEHPDGPEGLYKATRAFLGDGPGDAGGGDG